MPPPRDPVRLHVVPNPRSTTYSLAQAVTLEGHDIPVHFAWDGASIPRISWTTLGFTPFHPRVMRASVLHDFLYSQEVGSRKEADRLFHKLLLEDGVPEGAADLMFAAVRTFGSVVWRDAEDQAMLDAVEKRREEAP